MALVVLPEDVKSHLRGGLVITSITQCVIELILNALDAKATAIAIQLNFRTFRVQVVDNGDGISKANLNLVASNYATNKCHSLNDYKRNIRYHGYRGESLASMKEICSKLSITSRECNSDETYLRLFDGKVSNNANVVKFRPSEGTTVTLENVFFNLPVRQKRINPDVDFDTIKQFLDALTVIYPNVLFSLRNDATTKMLFKNTKHDTVVASIISYCPQVPKDSFVKIRLSKHKIRLSGLISKEMHANSKLQHFYINKRPIYCQKLRKLVNNALKSTRSGTSKKQEIFPIYALNIKCPYSDVDLSFEDNNYTASFVQFDVIKGFIGSIVETLRGNKKTEDANVNHNLKSENFVADDSYIQLCKIKGCVQSKIVKQNLEEVNSDEELINQPVDLEFNDNKKGTFDDIDTKNVNILKRKLNNEKPKQNFNENTFLKPYNEKKRRTKKNTINNIKEDEVDNLATPQSIEELIDDIPQPILSNNLDKMKLGKIAIMNRFLQSTQTYPSKEQTGYDENNMAKSSTNDVILNTPSVVHQSTTFSKHKIALNTSTVVESTSNLENTKGVQTSIRNFEEKCAQTSFAANINGKEEAARVYNINFSRLNLLGREKLNINLNINRNNVGVNFDLNRSKYFNNTIVGNCENEEEAVHITNSVEDKQSLRLGQSEYFLGSKSFNKLALQSSDSERPQHRDDSRSKDVISETIIEEVQAKESSVFYNTSHDEVQRVSESYMFHFKNTIPEDYRIWTDSSKSKLDFDCKINKPGCSKDYSPKLQNISNDTEVFKQSLKRHLTEPVNLTADPSNDSKKRFKTFLSQDASGSVQHFKKINKSNDKFGMNINDSMISSNLMKGFFDTSINDNPKPDKEWYTQNNGQFFLHKRTGLSTYKCPAAAKFVFNLKTRNEDIPKGNSPIITRADKCLFSLSQNAKDRLNEAIIKSYENELDTVKWGHFIKENDHKTFFTALFKTRAKNNPIKIPDISAKIIPEALVKMYNSEQSKNFIDDLFTNLEVIGQLDRKFILAFYKYSQLIFVFDQHAVHERIRLEQLQKSYLNEDGTFKSSASNAIYKLNFTRTEINCLAQIHARINNLGLHFDIVDNNVKVARIPTCLFNKFVKLPKSHEKETDVILVALFEEILTNIKNALGSLQVVPKVMQNIINSEACRGAIKFGEYLNVEDCQNLLTDLGKCNFPFQCAHGRPTLIPLIELTDNYHTLLEM